MYNGNFDGTVVKDPENSQFFFLELSGPRINFGWKQKVDLQNFVLEWHPTPGIQLYLHAVLSL